MPDENVRINNVEVFRAGNYGAKGNYTPTQIAAIAAEYNPKNHEGPITIDHKKTGPAWGWVKALSAKAGTLYADLSLVPEFASQVKKGLFKKRSIELFPDRKRFLSLTFLGAWAPAVKGMADMVFAEMEGEPIIFGEDAELDTPVFEETSPLEGLKAFLDEKEIPLKDSEGDYNEKLVGRAISLFSPGGFGEKHEKILPGDSGYLETKRRIADACFKLGKDPSWAELKTEDALFDPAITVEALKAHRPDIIDAITSELQEEIHMSDKTKEEMEAKEAELKAKTEECTAMSEELEAMKAKEAKAAMSVELDETLAKSELPEKAVNEIRAQFAECESLDGLEDRITGMKTVLEGMKFEESRTIDDNPPGAGEAGSDAAKMERAATIAKEEGISKGDAIRKVYRPEK